MVSIHHKPVNSNDVVILSSIFSSGKEQKPLEPFFQQSKILNGTYFLFSRWKFLFSVRT